MGYPSERSFSKPGVACRAPEPARFGVTSALSFVYLVLALACLIQWRTPHPWAQVDFFSGSYLGLRLLGAVYSVLSARRAFRSKDTRREWWGLTSNSGAQNRAILFMIAELAVFLDYGHWHLVTWLEQSFLQGLGLDVYAIVAFWQIWTDRYLALHFDVRQPERRVIREGPFRYIRHPRYAAAITGKAAFALVFASPLGWLLWIAWTRSLIESIRAEEAHLRGLFGPHYEDYARKTARLLPGIY